METRKERSRTICKLRISLSQTDPLERLKEFCEQAKYQYKINWDRYQNGYICECCLYYRLGKNNRNLKKEVRWIPTNDLMEAKRVISSICLDNMGLNIPEEKGGLEENPDKYLTDVVNLNKSWADIVEGE